MSYTTWDVETSIHTSYKRKGNPFDPRNFVVMSGYKRKGGPVVGDYFGRAGMPGVGAGLPKDWFTKLLEGTTLLVGQNIKFDLLYALQDPDNHRAWMKWVAAGGNVWDIQLAEYLLNGMDQASHMLSMDEMAPRYGGNVKFDEVKALWEAGISTEDIDQGLLRRYLCGTVDEHGDIGNTELVFLGQYKRAVACGQVKSILLNMGSLLCTVEMERNGMAVDKALGLSQAAEIADKLAALSLELNAHLPPDLPFQFNWGSAKQKSAIIFGGKVPYRLQVPLFNEDGSRKYIQKDAVAYYLEDGGLITEEEVAEKDEAWKALYLKTFTAGKNAGEYKTKKIKVDDLDRPKSLWTDFVWEFPGYTTPSARWKTKTEGQYQTGSDVLIELKVRGIPFLETLGEVTSLAKDLGTYYITTDEETGEQKGMLTLVQLVDQKENLDKWRPISDAWGIIHHMLNHTSTVTARFSSSNPNLQNLPKEGKSTVKTLFISRFRSGKIIQSDFTALEVYIQAILTKCKQLIADLLAGLDMHCARVASKEKITYEEAYRLCVVEKVKEWVKKRQGAKEFSFQRTYGAGVELISESTGMTIEEVKALISAENERYPEIERFYSRLTDIIKENSSPTGIVIEHPDIPGLKCHLRKSYYRTPDNKRYSYRENPAPKFLAEKPASKGGSPSSFSPTEIKNYIVQGEGGEWAKAAMWLAVRYYYKNGNWGGLALLVNQVHDALYSDAEDSVAFEAAAALEACMLAASEFMEWYFDWPIPVAVPSATNWGDNMMDEQAMPEGFAERVQQIRMELRKEYMDNYVPTFETRH